MNDLPKVYANQIDKDFNNTQDIFYGNVRSISKENSNLDIIRKINNIFASSSHVYKSKVKITLNGDVVEKVIVGKSNTHLITIDGEFIKINDILDIEKI